MARTPGLPLLGEGLPRDGLLALRWGWHWGSAPEVAGVILQGSC